MNTVEVLKNLFVRAGAGWVLWLLFALSFASVAIAVERWLVFRAKGADTREILQALGARGALERRRLDPLLAGSRSVGAAVAAAGLRFAHRGAEAAEKAMESALALERKALEARLSFLGTLGNNAPFIGLFGTVIGIVLAFDELGRAGGGAHGPGQAASQAVMGAIAEALVSTAVGIAVALPAVAFYNYYQRRMASVLTDAEAISGALLARVVGGEPEDPAPGERTGEAAGAEGVAPLGRRAEGAA